MKQSFLLFIFILSSLKGSCQKIIENVPHEEMSFIHRDIRGNWFRTDGSNDWVLGIYDQRIVYNNSVWKDIMVQNQGKRYQINLQGENDSQTLQFKLKKEKLLLEENSGDPVVLSREKTYNPLWKPENDEDFIFPVFTEGTAIYKGFIDGYDPKMGKTGHVYVNNILENDQESHTLQLESDGSFYLEIPMIYPQEVFVRILRMRENVYLEPGKTTFQYINLTESTGLNTKEENEPDRLLYMGDNARVNADLLLLKTIRHKDYNVLRDKVLDISPVEYKEYYLNIAKEEFKRLEELKSKHTFTKKALRIINFQIPYNVCQIILSYNMTRKLAYRQKNNISPEQREIDLEDFKPEPGYYDFINPDDLNNPLSLVSGSSYFFMLNRILFADCVKTEPNFYFVALKDSLKRRNETISEPEQSLLDSLISCTTNSSVNRIMKKNGNVFQDLYDKYTDLIASISQDAVFRAQENNLKEYFGLDRGQVSEIMYSQAMTSMIKGRQKPLNEKSINNIKSTINTPFITDYLVKMSGDMQKEIDKKLAANKNKTGYVINETPKTEGDKIFDVIMEKYRGKVVFVDFWATWCSPCRSGIENMKPLKEEMKDKDVVFVYITNPSSPVDTWNMMVPDIKGEHYRITQDEWNHMTSKFNITGIPHYVLVDKTGKVVLDHIFFASSIGEFKKLIEKQLE